MKRIEVVPVDNPVLECCDRGVACFIRIFEANTLPKAWSGMKRVFFILINFLLFGLCYAADWLFFTRWSNLRAFLPGPGQNDSTDDTGAKASVSPRAPEIFEIIRSVYFGCLIASAVLLVSMQCFIYLFALWRKTWRQTLVLVVEMLAVVIQACAPPILVCALFFMTGIGSSTGQGASTIKDLCRWQLLALGVAHAVFLLVWECGKLVSLGLCCCSCFSCCLFAWPLYRTCRLVCCDCDSSKDIEYQSTAIRHRTFSATVLDFMPPETDRGSWFAATKWFMLTVWTFPITVAGLMSCVVLISIVAFNRNFVYCSACQF